MVTQDDVARAQRNYDALEQTANVARKRADFAWSHYNSVSKQWREQEDARKKAEWEAMTPEEQDAHMAKIMKALEALRGLMAEWPIEKLEEELKK